MSPFPQNSDFCEKSGSELQKTENLPKNGKCVKWVPKYLKYHWFYKGWRNGARNVVFCAKGVEFGSFSGLEAQKHKIPSFAKNSTFSAQNSKGPKKGGPD